MQSGKKLQILPCLDLLGDKGLNSKERDLIDIQKRVKCNVVKVNIAIYSCSHLITVFQACLGAMVEIAISEDDSTKVSSVCDHVTKHSSSVTVELVNTMQALKSKL